VTPTSDFGMLKNVHTITQKLTSIKLINQLNTVDNFSKY